MPQLVIVSGMSGAGRTEAMHVFEDLDYFCIDNLPPDLIDDLLAMPDFSKSTGDSKNLAIVCDARGRGFFSSMSSVLDKLRESGVSYKIVFLDASDDKLIARY
ncbi:MAG: RNase adaptor protein RapZ, partial [Eggerthellaceae bacterium]|nr:RNase adaptor protein RapZ [Eggerthellaceae bacterium]